jgi:hypothetical protein
LEVNTSAAVNTAKPIPITNAAVYCRAVCFLPVTQAPSDIVGTSLHDLNATFHSILIEVIICDGISVCKTTFVSKT